MTDPLIQDIESYLAGDWDTWDVEPAGLLKQCLERLTQREEDSAPETPSPRGSHLYVGAAVRTRLLDPPYDTLEGVIVSYDPDLHPLCYRVVVPGLSRVTLVRKAEELEPI